jgi:hypothetical protein
LRGADQGRTAPSPILAEPTCACGIRSILDYGEICPGCQATARALRDTATALLEEGHANQAEAMLRRERVILLAIRSQGPAAPETTRRSR